MVYNHQLGLGEEAMGCNISKSALDAKEGQMLFLDEFSPSSDEFDALQKCVMKDVEIGYGKWFCVNGLRPVVRAIKYSLLDYIVVRDNFFLSTILATNSTTDKPLLIHYEVEKEEDRVLRMDVSIKRCMPFLQYLKLSLDQRGPAFYRLTSNMAKRLGGLQAGIIGRDGLRGWTVSNGKATPHNLCDESNAATNIAKRGGDMKLILLMIISVVVLPSGRVDRKFIVLWMVTASSCLEVGISRGAIIESLPDVITYSEEQYLHFLIPDLPDLPLFEHEKCEGNGEADPVCELTNNLNQINKDSAGLLNLLNKFMTTKGLGDEEIFTPDIRESNVELTFADSEKTYLVHAAGGDWYSMLEARLLQRKINNTPKNSTSDKRRISRAVPFAISAVLKTATTAAAAFGVDDLFGFFKSVFVGDETILRILTKLKAFLPVSRKAFAEISRKQSEFEVEARRLYQEVRDDGSKIRDITDKLEEELSQHKLDISFVQEGYTRLQEVLGDTTALIFTSALYLLHVFAFQTCRSHNVPMTFVPPKLLADSLNELLGKIDGDTTLAIPASRVQEYYSHNNFGSCIWDDVGGLVRVRVLLLPKSATYVLYKVRPIQYGYRNWSCSIDLGPTYAVKDLQNGMVFPVTDLDSSTCEPSLEKICKVPMSATDDITSNCVSLILSGASAESIKPGCAMKCVEHTQTEISKLSNDVFVILHPPENGLEIRCEDQSHTISEFIEFGVLRVRLPCSCGLFLNNKLAGRTTLTICDPKSVVQIDVLLPPHFTTLTDFIPWNDENAEAITKFKNAAEIFNEDFEDEVINPPGNDEIFTSQIPVLPAFWNALQTLLIGYSFFKMHLLSGMVLNLSNAIPMASAALEGPYKCKLPDELFYILIAIFVLSLLGILPQLFCCIYAGIRKLFYQSVEVEARKQVQQELVEINRV